MEAPGSNVSISVPINLERFEAEIRCHECAKLLTKVYFTVSLPPELFHVKQFSISEFFPELEIKVEIENKCLRCKNMDYRIFVM